MTSSIRPEYRVYRRRECGQVVFLASFAFFADAWWWAICEMPKRPSGEWYFKRGRKTVGVPSEWDLACDPSVDHFKASLDVLGM